MISEDGKESKWSVEFQDKEFIWFQQAIDDFLKKIKEQEK